MKILRYILNVLNVNVDMEEALNFWTPLFMGTVVLMFCYFVMCGGLSAFAK